MIYLAKKKEQKEKSLEQTLYDTAELQRGKVAPSDYKDIALGLLFLKFISYWYDQRRAEIEKETKDESEKNRNYLLNLKTNYTSKGVFFLKKGDRWDDLKQIASSEPNLAIKIDGILQQIEKDNPSLEKVLPDVFATSEVKNDNLQQLIENFDSIKTNEVSKDTFGKIYEYFLKMFHKKSGEKGGEFFTPKSIVELLVEILEPYNGIIYDPTCGSGGMFVQSYKFLDEHKTNNKNTLSPYGIESRPDIWRICKMNLAMRGINSNNILGPFDCLTEHPLEDLKANYILANPPFKVGEWGYEKLKNVKNIGKDYAKSFIMRRLDYLSTLHGFQYKSVSIRNQKTRWGSCSNLNNISLNIKLVCLPKELMDYISPVVVRSRVRNTNTIIVVKLF